MQIAHAFGATDCNGLEVLGAHDGTDAAAASRSVEVIHHGSKQDLVLASRADGGNAGQWVLMGLLDELFRFPDRLAPEVRGVL